MWPIRSSDEGDDLDTLVGDEPRQGGVVSQEVRGQELTKLHPLGGVNRQPFVCHQVL